MPPAERTIVWIIFAVSFVNMLDFMVVMPLGPDFARDLAIPMSSLGWIGGSYTAAAAVSGVVASFFLDRFPRKQALVACLVGLAVATLAAALPAGLWGLLLARVCAGLFGGPAVSVGTALLADTIPVERRGRAMGVVMGSVALATVFGVPSSLEIATWFGWKAPFVLLSALSLLVALVAGGRLPNVAPPHAQANRGAPCIPLPIARLRTLFALPGVAWSFALCMLLMGGMFVLIPNISAYVQQNLGYPRERLSLLYLVGGTASFGSMLIAGRLTDRLGSWPVAFAASGGLALVLLLGFVTQPPILPVFVLFGGFMVGMTSRGVPYQSLVSRIPTAPLRAQFMSLNSAATHLASALGAMLGPVFLSIDARGAVVGIPFAASVALASVLLATPLLRLVELRVTGRESSEELQPVVAEAEAQ